MIFENLFDLIFSIFSNLFSGVNIPTFDYLDYVYEFVELIFVNGSSALYVFIPTAYVSVLFGLTLFAEGALFIYHIIMFVLKKIPMLGIS